MLSPNVAGPGASACNRTAGVRGRHATLPHCDSTVSEAQSIPGRVGSPFITPVGTNRHPRSLGLLRQTKYHTAAAAAAAAPTTHLMYPPVPAAVVTPLHRIPNWGHAEWMAGRCLLVMTGWGMQECQACMQSSYPTMAVLRGCCAVI